MKKIVLILIIFFLVVFQHPNLYSQNSNSPYLPLSIGNVWVYNGYHSDPVNGPATYRDRYQVTGTIQSNGKTYFTVNHVRIILSGTTVGVEIGLFRDNAAIRIDSLSLNIYKNRPCSSSVELLVDSLLARRNDSANTCDYHGNRVICTDTSLYNICGMNRQSKWFSIFAFEGYNTQIYVKDIGVAAYNWQQHMESASYTLRGVVINGILCGDTSLTGIHPISNEIPNQFSLSQNYPNPFNPSTKIRFTVTSPRPGGHPSPERRGEGGEVKLIVFDVLGREVATLVNEQLQPGTYEVDWDGSNFPSGVYYYRIEAIPELVSGSGFTETKKMVLMK